MFLISRARGVSRMTSPVHQGRGTAGMEVTAGGHQSLWPLPGKLHSPGVEKGAALPHTPLLTPDKELKLLPSVFGGSSCTSEGECLFSEQWTGLTQSCAWTNSMALCTKEVISRKEMKGK